MTMLPERPEERRILVVLSPQDYEQVDFDQGGAEVAKHADLAFVSSQPPRSGGDLALDLQRRGLLVPGSVLVQNPFDSRSYFDLESAEDEISVRKSHLVVEVSQALGAKSVSVVAARDENHNISLLVEGTLAAPQGSGTTSFERQKLESLVSSAAIEDRLAGAATPDVEAASRILRESGLDDDMTLQQLVRARANTANPLLSRTVKVNVTREANRSVEAALEARTLVAQAGGRVKSSEVHQSSVVFTYDITFGDPS